MPDTRPTQTLCPSGSLGEGRVCGARARVQKSRTGADRSGPGAPAEKTDRTASGRLHFRPPAPCSRSRASLQAAAGTRKPEPGVADLRVPERGERRGLEPAAGVLRPARPRRLKNPPDARGTGSHRTRKQLACATRGRRGTGRTRRARRGTRPSGAGRHCTPVLAPLRRSERAPPGVDPAPDRVAPPNRGRERPGLTRRRRRLTAYGEFYRCLSTTWPLTPDRMHSPPGP